jgi:hypothetical protein
MLEALLVISIKEKENCLMKILFIKANLKQGCFMDKDSSNIKMDKFSKDLSKKIWESMEDIISLMEAIFKVPLEITCPMEMDSSIGQMESSIPANGRMDLKKV